MVGVGEVALEEVEYHIAGHGVVGGVHGELTEEVAHGGFNDHEGTEPVPQVVKGVETLTAHAGALVLKGDEGAPEFDGVGGVVAHEAGAEAEHVTGGQVRLTGVGVDGPVATEQVAVAAEYLLVFGVPDDELSVGVFAGVELIEVERLASAAAGIAEGYFAQTAYLAQGIGRVLPSDDVDLVVALVRKAQALLLRQFLAKQLAWWPFYDTFIVHNSNLITS